MDVPASKILRNFMRIYRIGEENHVNWRMIIVTILSLYMTSQAILALYMNWNNTILRYQALEDAEVNFFALSGILEHTLAPWIIRKELSMMDEPYYNYKGRLTDLRIKEMRSREVSLKRQVDLFIKAGLFYTSTVYIPPIIITFYKMFTASKGEEIQYHLLFPSECWFPFKINSFLVYILLYTYNIFYAVTFFHNQCAYMGAPIGVQFRITTELTLFKLSLDEIDQIGFIYQGGYKFQVSLQPKEEEIMLKYYFKHLVEHQNFIYRQLRDINTALSVSSLTVGQAVMLTGCLSMYCMLEMEEKHDKIKYFLAIIILFLGLFMYSINGQQIQNKGEEIRNAMYDCSWLDKPIWFKKSLLLMMTRANRITEIKPLGLYTINYKNVSSISNAAYAYCNFLRTTRQ